MDEITYNETQKQIITTDKPHVLVHSAAASGKTRTLVGRLQYLLDSGVPAEEIVAITFTNNAASVMFERLGQPEGLFIGTIHSYCNFLLRGGTIDTSKIIQQERFNDLFEEIKANPQCIKHVTHLLLDEAQDSTAQQFEFLDLINPDNFMYFGDIRQSIYGFNMACPEFLVNLAKRPDVTVFHMRQNYRNLPYILHFAKKFLFRLGPSFEDDSIPMRNSNKTYYGVLEGDMTPSEAIESLLRVKELLDTKWNDWFVLCRTNSDIELFRTLFEQRNIPTDTFRQADLTNAQIEAKMEEDTIKILTVHSAKGLEAPCVLSFNIRAYNDEEARLCYVSATRAKNFLIWARMPKKKKKNRVVSWE